MTALRYDVLGIGNAIVDVIARAEDDFLVAQGMNKGTMALIDEARAQAIYAAMGPAMESAGGSAANTSVGVESASERIDLIASINLAISPPEATRANGFNCSPRFGASKNST